MTPTLTDEQADKLNDAIRSGYSDKTKRYKENIQLITRPFYHAYHSAKSKLKEVVFKEEIEAVGTLIIPWPIHTQTIFYTLKTEIDKEGNWNVNCILTMFTKANKQDTFGLDLFYAFFDDDEEEGKINHISYVWEGFTKEGRDAEFWLSDLLLLKAFLKYADIETKVVNGGKKIVHNGEKIMNDTNRKVEILDSTYFTTISRTEGFGVSGHFRFQPWGPGMSQRRLQWISEFQKHGYTRKAKIDKKQL
jgi:hypothetical protein